jgi:hypothetical protein
VNDKKIDIINGAYSIMRISGLTVLPQPNETVLALKKLEALAKILKYRGICVGYNFENKPNPNSKSGLDIAAVDAFEYLLAQRLLPDFGKGQTPDPSLLKGASGAISFLYSLSTDPYIIQYPSRQPIGSGSTLRYNRFRKFFKPTEVAPNECATNRMYIDDVSDFVEDFSSYLGFNETIDSYVLTSDNGLDVSNEVLSSTNITYRVTATGNSGTKSDLLLRVKIIATTNLNRVETRIINFELTYPPRIS